MKHYISEARLNSYKTILKLKDEDQILRAYYWNKALCGANYPDTGGQLCRHWKLPLEMLSMRL